jgi:predicted transcriptional regulator
MGQMKAMTLRISTAQIGQLKRIAEKLQIDQTNVIRLAITRLAEQEGVALSSKRQSS